MKRKNSSPITLVKASFAASVAALVFLVSAAFAVETLPKSQSSAVASKGAPAASSSGAVGPKSNEYIEAIYTALKNPSSDARVRALEIIRERPSAFSPSRVKAALEDKDVNVKIQAVRALAAMNDRAGAAYLKTLAFTAPKLSVSPTVSERVRYFTAQNNRIKAIVALGDIKDTASTKQLEDATRDGDARVADAAWMSLAKMGNKRGAEIFTEGLKNTRPAVRAKSAEAVAEIGAVEALGVLRERITDWDKDVKINAVRSVGILRDQESAPRLREVILNEKDQSLREAAVLALGEIKDKESAAFLKKYASDENIVVRLAVCESLAKLGDYSGKEFVKALARRGAEKEARARAVKAMFNFDLDADDENILRELAFDEDPVTALEAVRVLAFRK